VEAVKKNTENQNPEEYGAREIKMNYRKNLTRGLEFAVIIHAGVILIYLLVSYLNNLNAEDHKKPVFDIVYVDIQNDTPPPAGNENKDIAKDVVKPLKDPAALEPVPVSKETAEEMTIKTQDELNNIISQVSHEGDSVQYVANNNGNIGHIGDKDIGNKIDNIRKPTDEYNIYKPFEVEKPPECVNLEMVKSSIEYPPLAIESGQEGMVTVKVLVGTEGRVIQVGLVSGPEIFHNEVKDKAKNLEFTVGLQNGKPVKVWMTIPFNFKLKN
jgi:TonB family protein